MLDVSVYCPVPPEVPDAPDAPDAPEAPPGARTVNVIGTLNGAGKLGVALVGVPDEPVVAPELILIVPL